MIPDREILDAILAHRRPVERKRLSGLLGIDDDADFAGTVARLVREGLLDRIERPAPGKAGVGWAYWPSAAGKEAGPPATAPAEEPAPTPANKEPSPMSTQHEVASRREKIIAYLTGHPGALASAVAESLSVDVDTVNRDIWAMKSKGRVVAVGDKRPVGYRVAGDGARARKSAAVASPKGTRITPRPRQEAAAVPKPAVAQPPGNFTVALTSNDTLLMLRHDEQLQVELRRDEILVLTGFLGRLDLAVVTTR